MKIADPRELARAELAAIIREIHSFENEPEGEWGDGLADACDVVERHLLTLGPHTKRQDSCD